MSKLPLWLPPGFDLGETRRIPVLRIVGVEEGSPEEAVLAERFAGSLRQFFIAQGRNQALGIAPQRRVRVDRGDHQIEYMNQFGQEFVTLHVHPGVTTKPLEKIENFVPLEFLDLRILGESLPADQGESAAYNAMIYVQGLYDPSTASTTPATSPTPYPLPPGVAVGGGLTSEVADLGTCWLGADYNVSNARAGWVDLRGFAPDAVVGVDIYVYHSSEYDAVEVQVGSSPLCATSDGHQPPDGTRSASVTMFTDPSSGNPITTTSALEDLFPEYTEFKLYSNLPYQALNDPTNPPRGHALFSGGMYGFPPEDVHSILHQDLIPIVLGSAPANVYWPDGSIKWSFYFGYENEFANNTPLVPTIPPSLPSWRVNPSNPDEFDMQHKGYASRIFWGPLFDLVSPPRPLEFKVWALGRMGGLRDLPIPEAYGPDISEDALPVVAEDIRVEANPMESAEYLAGFTVANHFNGVHIGTVYADRKHHAVAFVPARS